MAIILDPSESRDRRLKMLLDTVTSAAQIQNQKDELKLKQQELDPRVQAGKMANMLYMMGNTDAATKMFEYANTGNLPQGGTLPSQQGIVGPQIPNYIGGQMQPGSVQLPSSQGMSPMGVTGGTMKVGGSSVKLGQQGLDPMTDANLDIHKTLTTKKMENKIADETAVKKSITGTGRLLQRFGRSYNELKQRYPEIGQEGYSGFMTRVGARIEEKFDVLPQTSAFLRQLEPLANQQARDIEGAKITDKDREIYAKAMINALKSPDETNISLAADALIDIRDKGGDISSVISELGASDIDIMQKISSKVQEEFPDLKPKEIDSDDLISKWSK